jgi:hypothetical protein
VEFKHEVLKAPELLQAVIPEIEALDLPEDYRWEVGGEIEKQGETMPKLFKYLPHCGFLIIVLLIWQFNSFRRPGIILFTLPLAFVGALVGLFLFRAPFDFFGILGLLSLAGIIINNGIVLIDRIDRGGDGVALSPHLHDDDHHDSGRDAADHQPRPGLLLPGAHYCHWPGLRNAIDARGGARAVRRAVQREAARHRIEHQHAFTSNRDGHTTV